MPCLPPVEDSTKEFVNDVVNSLMNEIKLSMQDMNKNISDLADTVNGALLQQQFLTTEL